MIMPFSGEGGEIFKKEGEGVNNVEVTGLK
jgi:hypothetical protein